MTTLVQDVRYAFRQLIQNPGFTVVAVATLALGIGANTAIFSVVNGVLLRPLPYHDPEQLAIVWENDRLRGTQFEGASVPDFLDIKEQQSTFGSLAAMRRVNRTVTGVGQPERLITRLVTADYFRAFGVAPTVGRAFLPEEEERGRENVVILSHGVWQQRFGADRDVVGRSMLLDGEQFSIVGVMPPEAEFPTFPAQLWIPLAFTETDLQFRGRHTILAFGRLNPGVTLEQAQTEMSTIMARLEAEYPDDNLGRGATVVELRQQLIGGVRPALLVLLGAVVVVLVIACANVANLLLARREDRTRELGVRRALGAGRWRLIRQLLTESLVLSSAGGVAGLVLAFWGVDLLRGLGPSQLPRLDQVGVDAWVLGFALAVTILTGVIFGLVPAFKGSVPDLHTALKEGGRTSTMGLGRQRLRQVLVVSEVASAVVLVIAAGLLIRSFWRLLKVDPGYRPERVLALNLELPAAKYPHPGGWPVFDWPEVESFSTELVARVERMPGIQSAAISLNSPIQPGWTTRVTVDGRPAPPPGEQDEGRFRPVGENYFRTLGVPLRAGRTVESSDNADSRLVVVINEAFVRRYFPDEDPIGRSITFSGNSWEIVGVVGDVKYRGVALAVQPTMYPPFGQHVLGQLSLVVRTDGDPSALAPSLRTTIWDIDPDLAIYNATPLQEALWGSLAQQRFSVLLLALFAAVALLLATVGIYGVISYSVAQRTHELGVRMALGALRADVLRLVVGRGMILTGAAVAIGLVIAFALTRVMSSQLFEIAPTDLVTFVVVSLLVTGVALLACYMPARRATKVDPMMALRYE